MGFWDSLKRLSFQHRTVGILKTLAESTDTIERVFTLSHVSERNTHLELIRLKNDKIKASN